jgi:hypothetical protein
MFLGIELIKDGLVILIVNLIGFEDVPEISKDTTVRVFPEMIKGEVLPEHKCHHPLSCEHRCNKGEGEAH